MFVVSLSYTRKLDEVDALIPEHIQFLDRYYEAGVFLMSGRKVPRTGGVILAAAESRAALDAILAQDPFYKMEVARYEVTEFVASRTATQLASFAETV